MKKYKIYVQVVAIFIVSVFSVRSLTAQGYGSSLTFQGLNHFSLHSAAGRAMAGVSVGVNQNIGLMFQNPATLQSINGVRVSFGGVYLSKNMNQEQYYAPVRYYPNLSLLLEGLTAQIPDPDTTLFGFTAQDTVQRPFDSIGPNWSKSKKHKLPLQALVAFPFVFGKSKIVVGIGAVEYTNLNYYYQNNNVLTPSILSQRPLPIFRPADDKPLHVDWSQSIRSREGSINGYGFSLAGTLEKYNLTLGLSGLFLNGSSDDYEQQMVRGKLTFFSNAFRIDSLSGIISRTSTSDFSGKEFTISSILTGRYVNIGFSLKLPVTIIRKYTTHVVEGSSSVVSSYSFQGEDKMKLPLRGTLGISFVPKENLTLGLEYEYRPYKSVQYIDSEGSEESQWLSASLFRIGAEYRLTRWLAVRGGMRGEAEIFEAEGSQITPEPVTYTIYSTGFSLSFLNIYLNVAYENSHLKYQDIWSSAISKNSERCHAIVTQISYELPWFHH